MSQEIELGDDDGVIDVTIGKTTVTLDLWKTDAELYDFFERVKGLPVSQQNEQLAELIAGYGLPRPSHKMALKFAREIGAAVSGAKKNASPTANSPASTESTPET
jgi:hypothetical protein